MKKESKRLPEAELAVMQALWSAKEPITRPQLDQALADRNWSVSTVVALLSRLEDKGFLRHEKQGRGYLYIPVISREQYLEAESKTLLGQLFGGRPSGFIAALYRGGALTGEDIRKLRAQLDELESREAPKREE